MSVSNTSDASINIDPIGDFDFRGLIDRDVFTDLLADDDDSKREYSKGMVIRFVNQAQKDIVKMQDQIQKGNLPQLADLASSLGPSAGFIGAFDIQANCDVIEHFGRISFDPDDEDVMLTNGQRLKKIDSALREIEQFYERLAPLLKKFYGVTGG